jgi:choline dehydrogenase-like flavoprotein
VLRNCDDIPSGTALQTDVCIVGAGPAGLTIAKGLCGQGLRIALLERGGPPGRPQGLLDNGVTVSDSDFEAPPTIPARFAGGANEWIVRLPWYARGARMVPLSPIDLEARAWVPNSGWPIGWSELASAYRRANDLLGMGCRGYAVDEWETTGQPRLELESAGFTTAIERFSRSDVFTRQAWRDLSASSDVTIYLHARVGALRGSSDHIESVEIDAGARARLHITAQVFVLASGGLDNPRLLLSANDGRGVGASMSVVGRYYMDHLRFLSGELVPADRRLFCRTGLYDLRPTADGIVMGKIVPCEELLRTSELLHSGAALLPRVPREVEAALHGVAASLKQLREEKRADSLPPIGSFVRAAGYLARTVPEMAVRQRRFPPRTDAGWSSMSGNNRRYERFSVEHQVEQAPDEANQVRLSEACDPYGRPNVDITWRWGELDLRSARETQRLFGEAVEKKRLGTFTPSPWNDDRPPLTTPSGAYHPMGATRMNVNARHGVVDADARVHGVRNLFVAGSSVFPTGGYANPTLTLLAMSIRLADHLARRLTRCAQVFQSADGRGSFFWLAALGAVLF